MRRPAALLIQPLVLLSLFVPLAFAQITTDDRPRCLSNVCLNGGICFINREARSFECSCPPDTTGTLCETRTTAENTTTVPSASTPSIALTATVDAATNEVEVCSAVDCLNGGTCQVKNGVPMCLCRATFWGERCANVSTVETITIRPVMARRDPCDGVWCGSGMKCVSRGSLYNCLPVDQVASTATSVVHVTPRPVLINDHPTTPTDQDGKNRDPCSPNPCLHSALCSTSSLSSDRDYICSCLPGFTGGDCETNIDDCVGVVCQNAQHVCVDGVQTYECRCPEGYRGTQCDQNIHECAENPRLCRNGGTCEDSPGNYSCVCQPGFTGRFCEVDLDECAVENTCKFGICRNTPGSFECFCQPGYTGADCSQKQDDPEARDAPETCNSRPCLNNGVCQRNVVGAACLCRPGFSGKWCDEVVNVSTGPSEALTSGGLVGNLTDTAPTPTFHSAAAHNPCDTNPCQFDGTCVAGSAGAHHCMCHAGYTGSNCEIDEAECLSAPCRNGGECYEKSRPTTFVSGRVKGKFSFGDAVGFVCVCQPGYQGETCADRVKSAPVNCASNPCLNGSKCEVTNSGYQCVCPVGFVGQDCREDVNECLISSTCGRNAIKCINLVGSYRCMCKAGFGGFTDCETRLTGCETNSCTGQQICTPYLNQDGGHAHSCHCPAGKGGAVCASDTTASFNQTSQLAIVSTVPESSGALYELSLSMRTTLPNCTSVVSGIDVLGRVVFAINLRNGVPVIQVMGISEQLQPKFKGETLNDGEFWKIALTSENATVKMIVWDASMTKMTEATWPLPEGWRVFTTKLGGGSGQDHQQQPAFIGCIRDVVINGKYVIPAEHAATSLNVGLGCQRLAQCTNDTCNGNGKCVDLWDHFECDCKRPYLSPQCADSLVESTFGRENARSYARIEMSREEQQELEMTTDISMLVRTLQANGTIVFIGSGASADSDLDTFLAIELLEGQLRVNVKLGGRDVHSFMGGSRFNDGIVHEIRLLRQENSVTGFVDGKVVFTGEIRRPFPHPLFATLFYVGGIPATTRAKRQVEEPFPTAGPLLRTPTYSNGAFSTDTSFKGTIQDVRINGMLVPFWPAPTGVDTSRLFGRIEEQEEVLKGTVSDDTCREKPCMHGTCKVTFNDYECNCEIGWMDRTCSSVDHCAKNVCPLDVKCSNVDDGYLCLGAATLEKFSNLVYDLHLPETSEQPIFNNLSFKLRTRDHHGILFYASSNSSDNFLLLDLSNGALNLKYKLGEDTTSETNITGSYNITDGQWHAIKLTLLPEQSSVNVDTQQSAIYLSARSALSLSQLFVNGSKGQLTIGAPSNDQMQPHASRFSSDAVGYKGCLDEVKFGTLPMLSLMSPETYGGSLERTMHFKPISTHEVTSGVCQSEPQCALPDPVNGPCVNNATCHDLWNYRRCRCLPGFEGAFCETNIDDCKGNECLNGTCVDGIQSYTCACKHGFTGRFCDSEINECDPQPCQNAGTCHDLIGRFECTCNANFTGDKCEFLITVDCDSSPCQNGATCEDNVSEATKLKSFICQCPPGYTGVTCDREIDYCDSSPCLNGAVCTSRRESFSHFCACAPGFAGTDCEVNIDECESSPCLNGGVCSDGINKYQCNCTQGYIGETCAEDVDECKSSPCLNNGTCKNLAGSYECKCEKYYLGDHCEQPGSCLSNPCSNHAVCEQENATVHHCACSYEYTGVNCETEIDFCLSTPCLNGGSCERKLGGFTCQCPPGYTDPTCSVDINECASNPCQHMGRCVDQVAAYICDCASTGYEGENCDIDINECQNDTNCQNGLCENLAGTYKCNCHYGFIGSRCNKENLCLPADGQNVTRHQCKHGRCVRPDVRSRGPKGNEYDEFVYDCDCDQGYEGVYCAELSELVERAKGPPLTYIIGPVIGVIALLSVLGCLAFMFVARNKRATHGTYSPSRQEMSGARVQMNPMMKPPPEERLI